MKTFTCMVKDYIDAEPATVQRFFATFSRFEFALKRSGYVRGRNGDAVKPDWDRLAHDLKPRFNETASVALSEAVGYLASSPPKKQVLKDGVLCFADSVEKNEKRDLLALLNSTKCMRNNLFHGGKYPGSPSHDTDRNTKLLEDGLTIIGECLRLCQAHIPSVYDAFHYPARS